MTEERIITETGTDARIAAIIEPVIESMGYRLVRVRLSAQNGLTMQIMAERPDGTMTVTDCEAISRGISPVLDVEDPVDKAYHLEVSSAGIDRPLVRISDFKRWEGYLVRVDTSQIVAGRKRFRGYLRDVTDTGFVMERDQPAYGEENRAEIAFSEVGEAKLVLSDDLIRESLRADKAAMKARAEAEGLESDDTSEEIGDDTSEDAADVSTEPQDEN